MNLNFEKLMTLFVKMTEEQTIPAHYKELNFWYVRDDDEEYFQIHDDLMYEEPIAFVGKRFIGGSNVRIVHDQDYYKDLCNKFPELCE